MELSTPRLHLRPFRESDAEDLFDYARDIRVGPIAGWPPHESIEESRRIIATVFAKEGVFAMEDKASGRVIGSVGFVDGHPAGRAAPLLPTMKSAMHSILPFGAGADAGGSPGSTGIWICRFGAGTRLVRALCGKLAVMPVYAKVRVSVSVLQKPAGGAVGRDPGVLLLSADEGGLA